MHYELSSERTLILRGPASVMLLAGQATVLGAPIRQNQRRSVAQHKQSPIESKNIAEFDIVLGKNGGMFEIEGSTIPESWRQAVAALKEVREGTVIILGATDMGKSTLCTYLVNKLVHDVQRLCIIDADIGQADLGPPTTIGKAIPTQPAASLPEFNAETRLFIGHTSPTQVEREILRGIHKLSANEEKSLTIINTDGWVSEPAAVRYKTHLVADISPCLVLGLAYGDELQPILTGIRSSSLRVNAAREVLERTRGDRRRIRTNNYQQSLEGATTHRVLLRNIDLSIPTHFPSVTVENRYWLRNLIIGILDENGYLLQLGILRDIERNALRIYSRPISPIRRIGVGYVKLSISGREIGYV